MKYLPRSAIERLKNPIHLWSLIMGNKVSACLLHFFRIFFILVGNHDRHKSSDIFENRKDLTTDGGVSCP